MATTKAITVTVEELSKYGFKSNGRYVNYSKNLSEADKMRVIPGITFDAEVYVADSGKEYLNKVLTVNDNSNKVSLSTSKSVVKTKTIPKTESSMTKEDWAAKDRSQLIGGLSHDAAALVASFINVKGIDNTEDAVEMFKNVLNGLLKVRDALK